MAFWIVYQGNTWKRARAGGYLWAPKLGKKQQAQEYWTNMARVQPGDLIFAGVDNALRAIAEVTQPAYTAERPDPRDDQYWYGEGWRLDVRYTDLPSPFYYADWLPAVAGEMPAKYSPFSSGGRPNQGYLFALPNSAGEYLVERAAAMGIDLISAAHAAAPPPPAGDTQRATLTSARLGQGKFRDLLMKRWKGTCPLSAVSHPRLLRASHIKPWSSSNNSERLDPDNGLLLSAAYDAAFDAYLLSFADDGSLVLAPDFLAAAAQSAGIDPGARLTGLPNSSLPYLAEHRALMAARVQRDVGKI
jgi:hypothetical protein